MSLGSGSMPCSGTESRQKSLRLPSRSTERPPKTQTLLSKQTTKRIEERNIRSESEIGEIHRPYETWPVFQQKALRFEPTRHRHPRPPCSSTCLLKLVADYEDEFRQSCDRQTKPLER